MASRFYAVDVGVQNATQVTEGAATATKAIELQVDLTKTTDRLEVIKALQVLADYIATKETTPIA